MIRVMTEEESRTDALQQLRALVPEGSRVYVCKVGEKPGRRTIEVRVWIVVDRELKRIDPLMRRAGLGEATFRGIEIVETAPDGVVARLALALWPDADDAALKLQPVML